ncbi:MAG: hypothetical protein EA387_15175 [Nitriliruptor sp.]|nr:MAG: hypothetical protein EA387_15175 [Nitriliruptor sp.]
MSKALFGAYATPPGVALLDEVRRLRARVQELEEALAAAEAAAAAGDRSDDTQDTEDAPSVDEVPAPAGR